MAAGWRHRRQAESNLFLASGYVTAVAAAPRLVPSFRTRRPQAFLAFEAGTLAVVAGWALRERWGPAVVNGAALAGLGTLWWITGRQGGR